MLGRECACEVEIDVEKIERPPQFISWLDVVAVAVDAGVAVDVAIAVDTGVASIRSLRVPTTMNQLENSGTYT